MLHLRIENSENPELVLRVSYSDGLHYEHWDIMRFLEQFAKSQNMKFFHSDSNSPFRHFFDIAKDGKSEKQFVSLIFSGRLSRLYDKWQDSQQKTVKKEMKAKKTAETAIMEETL